MIFLSFPFSQQRDIKSRRKISSQNIFVTLN